MLRGNKLTIIALVDTGNYLTKGTNGAPVSLLEEHTLQPWSGIPLLECHPEYITYRTLNGTGTLCSIVCDSLQIHQGFRIQTFKHPCVALYPGIFSKKNEFQMILHPAHCKGR